MGICVKNGEVKNKNWNLNKWRSENQKVKNKSGKVKNKNEITLWLPWGLVDRKRVGLAGPFAAILEHSGQLKKPWARITAESRMFVCWNNDSNEEKKGNWDSKRL